MASETPGGAVKTFFVFMDLPKHIEYKVHPMPLIPEGAVIRFESLSLRDPSDRRRVRVVNGEHSVLHRRLVYSPTSGLLQYLEIAPLEWARGSL